MTNELTASGGLPAASETGEAGVAGRVPDRGGWLWSSLRRGMGLRLLTAIVLFSSLVTLISTALQLYIDYRADVSVIHARFDEIEKSYLGSLSGSLWTLDVDQIRLQLEGIRRLPGMRYLEASEIGRADERRVVVAIGQPATEAVIARDYPMTYAKDGGTVRFIGVLHVEATLSEVYHRLLEKAVVILVSQGVKTFLVSLFILFIVHRLVTRHLAAIAGFLHDYDPRSTTAPLVLSRRKPGKPDELDQMTAAFNTLSARLQELYRELAGVNAELEWDIAARQQAEAEVTRLNAELEQRVRQRTAELEAANRELDAFTYSVSHDLRAPLRRIEGFGRILSEDYADRFDERGQHFLERIRAGSQEMADMIDSFLKLSRSTRSELTVESANLSELAEAVVARLREREPERAVAVSIAPGLTTRGDRRLLGAVLENLLGNAWKYTRHTEAAAISLTVETVAGHAVYVVRDNGAGFDMAYADRLFMPFSRLHRPEDFEGTGIGLATVVRILTRHGGRIWAEGAVGKGATFRFTLWEGSAT